MKLAIIGPVHPFRGGIAYFSGCLYKELTKQGHQVLMINFSHQYPALLFPGKKQTEDNSCFRDVPSIRSLTPYNPFTYRKTCREILDFEPNLVIFCYFLPFFMPAYYSIQKKLNKKGYKTMILAHNIDFHEKWLMSRLLTKKLLNNTDHIMTLSKQVFSDAQDLVTNKGKRADRSVNIIKGFHPLYDFHNQNRFDRKKAKELLGLQNKRVIFFFGYIKPYKGVDLLIKSFPLVKKKLPDTVLLIVGEVYGKSEIYEQLITQTGYASDVIFRDEYISSGDVELYYKGADVLVLPYRQATQSGVIQTAYVMDLGVVVTPVGGLPEMIIDGKTGIVANSACEDDIALAIEKFFALNNDKLKKNIAEQKTKYSWQNFVQLLLSESAG